MTFSTQLNHYMNDIKCSASELSTLTGIPLYTISKYCSGKRRPKEGSDTVRKLAEGVRTIAQEKNVRHVLDSDIVASLDGAIHSESECFDYPALITNLQRVLNHCSITVSALSEEIHYHRSTLYGLLHGRTKLRDPDVFTRLVAQSIVKRFGGMEGQMFVSALIGWPTQLFDTKEEYLDALTLWLSGRFVGDRVISERDLQLIKEIDIGEFKRYKRFKQKQKNMISPHISKVKEYIGMDGMEAAVADFVDIASVSKHYDDIILYGNFPIEHMLMAANAAKTCAKGLTAAMQKGIRIKSIQNTKRPMSEIMDELNFWLPLLMSGQIIPMCIEEHQSHFHNLIFASGGAVLRGSCVEDDYDGAYFQLFTDQKSVLREYHAAEILASSSIPLVEIYTKSEKDRFEAVLSRESQCPGQRDAYLCAPPIYTISDELLTHILKRTPINDACKSEIRAFVQREKNRIEKILANNVFHVRLTQFLKREFNAYPIRLSLTRGLLGIELFYTYEEYTQHIALTEDYAKQKENYRLELSTNGSLRNMQINILGQESAWILKSKYPEMLFHVKHPFWVQAITEMLERSFNG